MRLGADGGHHGRLGRLVQARGRLVEQQDRRPADERPRDARPAGAARSRGPRRARPGPATAATSPSPTAASAAATASSSASGAPSRTLSATVPANRYGACGTQATRPAPCLGSRSRTSTGVRPPPATPAPARPTARANPRITASSVLLPAPLGPVTATTSPGRTTSDAPAGAATSRPGCATDTPSTTSPSGPSAAPAHPPGAPAPARR